MKTIMTTLPVYDRLEKQCFERGKKGGVDQPVPIITPRFRLPSMQWNAQTDDPGELNSIEMIERNPDLTEMIVSWTGSTYDTFTTVGNNITSAIDAGGTGRCFTISPVTNGSNRFTARRGEKITFTCTATLNSGAVPSVSIYDAVAAIAISNTVNLTAGANTIEFTLTQDTTKGVFYVATAGATNFAIANASGVRQGAIDIYHFFKSSEFLNTAFANVSYNIFSSADGMVISIEKTVAAGVDYGQSNTFAVTENDKILVGWSSLITSGTAPKCVIVNAAGNDISNVVTLSAGLNLFEILSVTETDANARVRIRNLDTEEVDCDVAVVFYKTSMPGIYALATDEYFQYKGDTLYYLLPTGTFYLKMESDNGYVYYSDWFQVECVYENLITAWANSGYETLTTNGTEIQSLINSAGIGIIESTVFSVIKGQSVRLVFNVTTNSGTLPNIYLTNQGWTLEDSGGVITAGLNDITLTSTWEGNAYIVLYNNATNVNCAISEVLVMREYSEKYLTINFSNTCDLGDILYHDGFTQALWFESEAMEPDFPIDEKGVENGEGKFIRTFARQVKKYTARTLLMPSFMVDVFNRMKLHDTVELIDLVGDVNDLHNLEVEHEWLWEDRYYAKFDLTFDYDEAFVIGGCCNNLTV